MMIESLGLKVDVSTAMQVVLLFAFPLVWFGRRAAQKSSLLTACYISCLLVVVWRVLGPTTDSSVATSVVNFVGSTIVIASLWIFVKRYFREDKGEECSISRWTLKAGRESVFSVADGLFPSRWIASLCLLGFVFEVGLHACSSSGIFRDGLLMSLFAVSLIACFWGGLGWGIYLLGKISDWVGQRSKLAANSLLAITSLAFTLGLYVCIGSWMLQGRIGRFAALDVYLFLWVNPSKTMWANMGSGERVAAITATLAIPVVCLLFIRLVNHCRDISFSRESHDASIARNWLFIVCLTVLNWQPIAEDPSVYTFRNRLAATRCRLHPAVTLASSGFDLIGRAKVLPNIDTQQLDPITDQWSPAESTPTPSVIFIAVESLRADVIGMRHQGREVTPCINALAERGLKWNRAYAQSTHSDYADVCIVSSLYPLRTRRHHYYRADDPWPKSLAFDLFKKAGYATAIISSQNEAWGGMDQFLETPSLDLFFDSARSNLETYTPIEILVSRMNVVWEPSTQGVYATMRRLTKPSVGSNSSTMRNDRFALV